MRRRIVIGAWCCLLLGMLALCAWEIGWLARAVGTALQARSTDAAAVVADIPAAAPQPPAPPARTATPTPPAPQPTAAPLPVRLVRPARGSTTKYTVQPGDTLLGISLGFDVPIDTLVVFNDIDDPDWIYAGQELVIPGEDAPTPTRPAVAVATVKVATRRPDAPVPPAPGAVNGVPVDRIAVISGAAAQNVRRIYSKGQTLGNNPQAFSKIGDSNMEAPYFLAGLDEGPYNLGQYAYLEPAVEYFAGSFGRRSMSVRIGFHSWSVLDPEVGDKTICFPQEPPISCEYRLHKPSIALIRLGTNDAGYPDRLRNRLQSIVDYLVERGVVPVLGTKADRAEGDDTNNGIIRSIAAANNIPLWDLDRVTQTLPDNGLDRDHIHLTLAYSLDYTSAGAFQRGHSVDNLTALIALDRVWAQIK